LSAFVPVFTAAVPSLPQPSRDLGSRQRGEEAAKLATDMKEVEAVIKMFDPAFNCRAISARDCREIAPRRQLLAGEQRP
jgi:hypothetical protein